MKKFLALAGAITKGLIRDRETLFFTLVFPLLFIVLFGSIFGGSSSSAREVLVVGDSALIDQLPEEAKDQLAEVITFVESTDLDDALSQVQAGDADAAIEQDGDTLVLHLSVADQTGAGIVVGIFDGIVNQSNLSAAGVTPQFDLRTEQVEDESLTAIQWIAPGMIAYGIALGATFGAAMTLVTWREKKVLRRLRLAPVPTATVVGSRVLVSLAVAFLQLAIFVGVATMPFLGMQLSGSWYMAIPLVFCGTLAFLSIGLLIGAIAKTAEGASALANLITLPMAFLSGAFIPLTVAPDWISTVSQVLPLGHLVTGLQDVLVRGQGPESALAPMGILLGFTAVLVFLATKVFRWEES